MRLSWKKGFENASSDQIENRVRSMCLRRHTSLDFARSTVQFKDNRKLFLGREDNDIFQVTRIRALGLFLPKLIIEFRKKDGFNIYYLRPSFGTFAAGFILLTALSLNLVYSIAQQRIESDLWEVLFVTSLFTLLLAYEFEQTTTLMSKVLESISDDIS